MSGEQEKVTVYLDEEFKRQFKRLSKKRSYCNCAERHNTFLNIFYSIKSRLRAATL